MPPFYVTTPIYYVNDVPHIGHAYATVIADALARWHRLAGDDGLLPHRDRRARGQDRPGGRGQRGSPRRSGWTGPRRRFVEAWATLNISNDDFIRTTEPRHHRAVQQFLQKIHDNGYTELGVYRGLYCVYCEDYKKESDLVDGMCAIHLRPVEMLEEENYFFKLSDFGDRLLQWYEDHPDAIQPDGQAQRGPRDHQGRPRGHLHHPDVDDDGVSRCPGTPPTSSTSGTTRSINYLTAIGYGEDPARFDSWWPAVHHLLGKDIIRFHCVWWPAMCMAAGIDPPAHFLVHRLAARVGREDVKSGGNQVTSGRAGDRSYGVDAFRYHLLRDTPLGSDGDFSYEGVTARYNADLANNLGNLMARVATVVGSKCGGHRAGPRSRRAAAPPWPPTS